MAGIIVMYGSRLRLLGKPDPFAEFTRLVHDAFEIPASHTLYFSYEYEDDGDGGVIVLELDPSAYGLVGGAMVLHCVAVAPSPPAVEGCWMLE